MIAGVINWAIIGSAVYLGYSGFGIWTIVFPAVAAVIVYATVVRPGAVSVMNQHGLVRGWGSMLLVYMVWAGVLYAAGFGLAYVVQ